MFMPSAHGGEVEAAARRLGIREARLLDASASLVPWSPRLPLLLGQAAVRGYPDRSHISLRGRLAALHGIASSSLLPGNGAAELFTWAARDASEAGVSVLPAPRFDDYSRALACWAGSSHSIPLATNWSAAMPHTYPVGDRGEVLWICNPHNPTGQLWSRKSLESLLHRYRLVICDEAFLSLVPDGEQQSLIPLVADHANLVVIRSLTKLYGIAGLRLGYAVAQAERLQRWAEWRDPWPVNGIATVMAEQLLSSPRRYKRWCQKAQAWVAREGAWMQQQLVQLPGITPMPSSVNFVLIRAEQSLVPLREALEVRHRILLRDCRSFEGLGENWLRIGLQSRRGNRRIIRALQKALKAAPLQ
jgi:histidinol-phosphate/aromatic aminotransferase/cobyric acid decarboxylase-like protein